MNVIAAVNEAGDHDLVHSAVGDIYYINVLHPLQSFVIIYFAASQLPVCQILVRLAADIRASFNIRFISSTFNPRFPINHNNLFASETTRKTSAFKVYNLQEAMHCPLPRREGPKLGPFEYKTANHEITFLKYIGGGLHGHIFKVKIEGTIYALKMANIVIETPSCGT